MDRGGLVGVHANTFRNYGTITNNISFNGPGTSITTMPTIYDTQAEMIRRELDEMNKPSSNGRMAPEEGEEDSDSDSESETNQRDTNAILADEDDDDDGEEFYTASSSSSTQRVSSMKRKAPENRTDIATSQQRKKRNCNSSTEVEVSNYTTRYSNLSVQC